MSNEMVENMRPGIVTVFHGFTQDVRSSREHNFIAVDLGTS